MFFYNSLNSILISNTGNSSNFLFWPGGFDEPQKKIIIAETEVDFENNLKTIPKSFQDGIEFMSDKCTPTCFGDSTKNLKAELQNLQENINLKSVIDQEGCSLAFWSKTKETEENKAYANNNKQCGDVNLPNIDELIEPLKQSKIPVLKISEAPKSNQKTKWAEQIDIMVPVTDFDKKIPEPAMIFPYELDNFQKQAILKLEEQCDVFVAAHTSAGKTTIAEYAIAMSQKNMTRFNIKLNTNCVIKLQIYYNKYKNMFQNYLYISN